MEAMETIYFGDTLYHLKKEDYERLLLLSQLWEIEFDAKKVDHKIKDFLAKHKQKEKTMPIQQLTKRKAPKKKVETPKKDEKTIIEEIRRKYPPPPGKNLFRIGRSIPGHYRVTFYNKETGMDLNPSFLVNAETLEIADDNDSQANKRKYLIAMKKKNK